MKHFEHTFGVTPIEALKTILNTDCVKSNFAAEYLLNEMLCKEIRKQEEKEERRRIADEKASAFRHELYNILENNRNRPMTPTEIQFEVACFVERYITNQKVAHHLCRMQFTEEFPELARYTYAGRVYYIVGNIPPHIKCHLVTETEW